MKEHEKDSLITKEGGVALFFIFVVDLEEGMGRNRRLGPPGKVKGNRKRNRKNQGRRHQLSGSLCDLSSRGLRRR